MARNEPVPIGDALDSVVRSLRGPSRAVIGGVVGRWDEVVGTAIAQHVRPMTVDGGVLTVIVDDPAWATQMKFLSPQIIDAIRAQVGVEIERIEVRVDGRAARGQKDWDGRSRR